MTPLLCFASDHKKTAQVFTTKGVAVSVLAQLLCRLANESPPESTNSIYSQYVRPPFEDPHSLPPVIIKQLEI